MKLIYGIALASALVTSSLSAALPAAPAALAAGTATRSVQVENGGGSDEVVCLGCTFLGASILYAGALVWPYLMSNADRVLVVAAGCLSACSKTLQSMS